MFAIEIDFDDGVSQPETIYVRRPQVVIGASDYAHVVIEDMKDLGVELRILRDVGRRLRCKPIGTEAAVAALGLQDKVYDNCASISFAGISLHVQALDSDLIYRDGEPPDRAGVRVLQAAAAVSGPKYPAIMVFGQNPMMLSFSPRQSVTIGRSNQCIVRLEGGSFLIEDLGSTNGTFVDQQQIGGPTKVAAGMPIVLSREVSIAGIDSEELAQKLYSVSAEKVETVPPAPRRGYPALVCISEGARPARVALQQNASLKLGRDPASDMWLGVPHVSRIHCLVSRGHDSELIVKDMSTNGTRYDDGVLHRGETLAIHQEPKVLDFGGGITVAICFNEDQEREFIESRGAPSVFVAKKSPRFTRSGRGTSSLTSVAQRAMTDSPSAPEEQGQVLRQGLFSSLKAFVTMLDARARVMLYITVGMVAFVVVLVVWLLKSVVFA